jgi:hypothetical protein
VFSVGYDIGNGGQVNNSGCSISSGAISCPNSFNSSIGYSTGLTNFGPGVNTMSLTAVGFDNKSSTTSWNVDIDNTAPSLSLGGALAGDNNKAIADGSYPLTVSTADGTSGGSLDVSGVANVSVIVNGTAVSQSQLTAYTPCSASSQTDTYCPISTGWTLNAASLPGGVNTIEVTTTDNAGNVNSQTITVYVVHVPTISGTPKAGQGFTVTAGSITGSPTPTYSYQWQNCTSSDAGCTNDGTGTSYATTTNDVGGVLQAVETATVSGGRTGVRTVVHR